MTNRLVRSALALLAAAAAMPAAAQDKPAPQVIRLWLGGDPSVAQLLVERDRGLRAARIARAGDEERGRRVVDCGSRLPARAGEHQHLEIGPRGNLALRVGGAARGGLGIVGDNRHQLSAGGEAHHHEAVRIEELRQCNSAQPAHRAAGVCRGILDAVG